MNNLNNKPVKIGEAARLTGVTFDANSPLA